MKTNRHHLIRSYASGLVTAGKKPKEIYLALMAKGVHSCVATEWANEPLRRAAMERRQQARKKARRHISRRGTGHRRVIFVKKEDGRERVYHATKGWRSYRLPA